MSTLTLTYVDVERPEDFAVPEANDFGGIESYTADPTKLPGVEYVEALDWLLDHPDDAMCAFADLVDEASGQMCSNSIGFVLYDDDDAPHRLGWVWKWTTLVGTDEGVAAVCEDCAPQNLYATAAGNAKAVREEGTR